MADLYAFIDVVAGLKDVERAGWIRREVEKPESVADHSFRMAILILALPDLDTTLRQRAVMMAIVHDIGECLIGDITPFDGITKQAKYEREELAVKYLACTIRHSNPSFADQLLDLWYEYEESKTHAAMLVQQVDALECMQQALIYMERAGDREITDFYDFMKLDAEAVLPELQPLLAACHTRFDALKSSKQSPEITLFVSGPPGVGKGTQCASLAHEFALQHISVGELLRAEAANVCSPYQTFIKESMEKSITIPAQLTTRLLMKEMAKVRTSSNRGFLLDGFPRSMEQVIDFERKVTHQYVTISLVCSDDNLLSRLAHRSKSSGRVDDDTNLFLRRLEAFSRSNPEIEAFLQKRGAFHVVDCNDSIEVVRGQLRALVAKVLK